MFQFIYFYYKDSKRVPILTDASRDLKGVLFPKEKQSIINDFSVENELFVWIDGTEFLV